MQKHILFWKWFDRESLRGAIAQSSNERDHWCIRVPRGGKLVPRRLMDFNLTNQGLSSIGSILVRLVSKSLHSQSQKLLTIGISMIFVISLKGPSVIGRDNLNLCMFSIGYAAYLIVIFEVMLFIDSANNKTFLTMFVSHFICYADIVERSKDKTLA